MDYSILDKYIVGRVEPQIYAFTTGTVPDYLKVGDTYRPLEQRLGEWRRVFPDLEKKFATVAKVDEEVYFRDFSIHFFWKMKGIVIVCFLLIWKACLTIPENSSSMQPPKM